jgi:RES domain-containing protein
VRLWRISDFADLSGYGGLLADARWHSRGHRIVYLADHPASALLEVLVHLEVDADELPDTFRLLAVNAPGDMPSETLDPAGLPDDWAQDFSATRRLGNDWLEAATSSLLQVPSAIVPASFNWLLNPLHPDAASVTIDAATRVRLDPRLFGPFKRAETPAAPAPGRRARGRSPRPSGGRGRRRKRTSPPAGSSG